MDYQRLSAVHMYFVNCYREEIYIGTDNEEDRHEKRENKVDVTVDPTEVSEAIHSFIVQESVHKERTKNNEKRDNITKKVVLNKAGTIRFKDFNKENIDLKSSNQHPEE